MKFGVFGLLVVLLCSCGKDTVEPHNNIEGTWRWLSTIQDSTFAEDTSSSSNRQILTIVDYKNMDWKRNDTTYYNGVYTYGMKMSQTLGVNKLTMKLSGISYGLMLNHVGDTLWIQEDRVGGFTYRFYKD